MAVKKKKPITTSKKTNKKIKGSLIEELKNFKPSLPVNFYLSDVKNVLKKS